jgi:amidophosphoribosyltransferase
MDENTLYAARDPQGIRPMVLGRLERGWVVASETAALDIVGASFVREIEAGELIAIDENGLRSQRFAEPEPKGCLFEYVYLARPDTTISGVSVNEVRVEVGRRLAREAPVEADLVIPVPESGTPAAIGYSQESGIVYAQGLVKNAYVGRNWVFVSSSIRCAMSSKVNASSLLTTPSCVATPNVRSCACCAKPALPKYTCGSPLPPSSGLVFTASTLRVAQS